MARRRHGFLVANIHRQDLSELDEARALQRLLAIHGSQTALAKRLHRSQEWVSQRLALLGLTPELQARIGGEPIDLLRAVGSKPPEQQEPALAVLKQERARKETEKRERKRKTQTRDAPDTRTDRADGSPDGYYDVIEGGGADGLSSSAAQEAGDGPASAGEGAPNLPAQFAAADATAGGGEQQPKRFPYEDGVSAAQHLIHKMPLEEFDKMLDRLIKHRDSHAVSTS
ncbi:ParB/RepB/Spo0J family partition protein [Streptomyces nigra]|uniref:ParB/RepB/Spo0J family partition protein n=1 Tax=Streptomyces nigra TaxID=1827580 RepID=UPI0035DC2317